MAIDYNIQVARPGANFDLQGLFGIAEEQQERQREADELEQQRVRQAQGAEILKSGDVDAISDFMIRNPDMRENLIATQKHKSEGTKAARVRALKRIVMGEDVDKVLADAEADVLREGGTVRELKEFRDAGGSPAEISEKALIGLSIYEPNAAKAFRESTGRGGEKGLASAKTEILDDGTIIQALPNQEVIVRNRAGDIVTGQDRLDALDRSNQFREERRQREATRKVETARRVAAATGRESRISEKRKELSQRNTNAARNQVKVRQALQTAANATQGVSGSAKMALAKIFPNIDVTNEALLDQSLKQLAIEQLSNFKGPTTDFEFEKVESSTGALGDPQTANIARLKALQRNNWFMRREADQFKDHVKGGGDPDEFAFDFEEPIKIKGGNKEISLMDLQETAAANNMTIEETLKALNR